MKMWSLTSARTLLGLIAVSAVIQQGTSQITQQTINEVASDLKIAVIVNTNHNDGHPFNVQLSLKNTGDKTILTGDDWVVRFSMSKHIELTKPEFLFYGLRIKQTEGCFFEMSKKPGALQKFPGIKKDKIFRMTFTCRGYSLNKYVLNPNFEITAQGLASKVIANTKDVNLGFVLLSHLNESTGAMTAFRRYEQAMPIADYGGIGMNLVVPKPKMLNTTNPDPASSQYNVTLSENDAIHLWMDDKINTKFKAYVTDVLVSIIGVGQGVLLYDKNNPPKSGLVIMLRLSKKDNTKTEDAYTLVVRGPTGTRPYNLTHIEAPTYKGLSNAVETFKSMIGVFDAVPLVNIVDDASMGKRMVKLDVTQNYMEVSTVKKLLYLMRQYKLNLLVLVVGSDSAIRFQLDGHDFDELNSFGPAYPTGRSRFYSSADFKDLILYANSLLVDVVPYVQLIGSFRPAKKASHLRYSRLKNSDITEAQRLHLMSGQEPIMDVQAGSCYTDGVLDPCHKPTHDFAKLVMNYFKDLFEAVGVKQYAFHAGGDMYAKYFGNFESCKNMNLDQNAALNHMLKSLQGNLYNTGIKLMVHEFAVRDTTTGTCLEESTSVDRKNLIVEFTEMYLKKMKDWNLTGDQEAFLLKDVVPYNRSIPTSRPDYFIPFIGTKKGMPEWSRAYDCINKGYKGVLSPDNVMNLNNPHDFDFNGNGDTLNEGLFLKNQFEMLTYEPYNLYIHMDTSSTGKSFHPHRLANLFDVKPLRAYQNVVGMQASVKTTNIRNEAQLWNTILPELLCASQVMWDRPHYKGHLKAEDPNTLNNPELAEMRTDGQMRDFLDFANTVGHKEAERLELGGYPYRLSKPQLHFYCGLRDLQPPPWPLIARTEMPGTRMEIRKSRVVNGIKEETWIPLSQETPQLFMFPPVKSAVVRSVAPRTEAGTRKGKSYEIQGKLSNYLPKYIPMPIRGNACLSIRRPETTVFEDVTRAQWDQVLKNLDNHRREQNVYVKKRYDDLAAVMRNVNRENGWSFIFNETLSKMEMELEFGRNISNLQTTVPSDRTNATGYNEATAIRLIHDADKKIHDKRVALENQKMQEWDRQFQRCRSRP